MSEAKITLVGAGGMSFGPSMVNDVVHTRCLAGSRLVLHDVAAERLQRAYQFAAKLNSLTGAPIRLDYSTDPAEALDGADFVLSSAEFGRFRYWRQDYEIPNRYGARQINGENGGPGAVFHSLRSIKNTLEICRNVEKYAPDAFLINLTNPMSRVTLAINRATKVRNAGMCHEMPMGVNRLCRRIRVKAKEVEARASGINHFTFFTEFRNQRTGEDLLPRLRNLFAKSFFAYSPRTQKIARVLAGYHEIQSPPARFRIIDRSALAAALGVPMSLLSATHAEWVAAALAGDHRGACTSGAQGWQSAAANSSSGGNGSGAAPPRPPRAAIWQRVHLARPECHVRSCFGT